MSEKSGLPIPQASFGLSELEAMERVVWSYKLYLQRAPVTEKNTKRIQTLERIRRCLAIQLASEPKEVQMFLNLEELEELLQVMLDFVSIVKRLFPKDEGRDAVIASVNRWRLRLIHILSEWGVD